MKWLCHWWMILLKQSYVVSKEKINTPLRIGQLPTGKKTSPGKKGQPAAEKTITVLKFSYESEPGTTVETVLDVTKIVERLPEDLQKGLDDAFANSESVEPQPK